MKTIRIPIFGFISSLFILAVVAGLRADPYRIVDAATGSEHIDGFKLLGTGIYWWKTGIFPDQETEGVEGVVGIRQVLDGVGYNRAATQTYEAIRSKSLTAPPGGVERVGDKLFYYFNDTPTSSFIYRRSVFPTATENPIAFSGSWFNRVGAMATWGGRLYWTTIQGQAMQLRSKAIDAGPGGGDIIEFTISNADPAKKILVADEILDDSRPFATELVILTTGGQVYLYEIQGQLAGQTPRLLEANVTDIAVRNEAWRELGEPRTYGTMIYLAVGLNLSASRPNGRLNVYNLTDGAYTTMHDTGSRDSQITSVAVDQDRIFITRTPVSPGGTLNLLDARIARRNYKSDRLLPFDNLTSFEDLFIQPAQQEGRQLVSDRQWIYWIHLNEIRKIKTDTPGYQLDYAALTLEAVQAVQTLDNSVPLVAGKPTLVRGYAAITANSANLTGLKHKASLRVIRNGEIVGEVAADNKPLIDFNNASIVLRSEFNRSFHFYLPPEWITSGPLRLQMIVNPNMSVPETGAAPLDNNIVVRDFAVVNVASPCLVFKAMRSNNPNYDGSSPTFWSIIDRTLSLMPVPGFNVRFSPGDVSKPVPIYLPWPPRVERRAFTMPDDKDWALMWMTLAHALSRQPDGCNDTHWVGMFPPEDRPWNGIGGVRGLKLSDVIDDPPADINIPSTPLINTSCVRMDSGMGNSASVWNNITGGHTLAHELGHNYGRFHIDQTRSFGCGISKPDGPWHVLPDNQDPCTLGLIDLANPSAVVGYDPLNDVPVLPNMAGDLMTYANSSWITPFTWNALLAVLPKLPSLAAAPALALSAAPGNVLFVQGFLRPRERVAVLYPAFALPPGIMDPAKIEEMMRSANTVSADSVYRLRLIGNPAVVPLDDRPLLFLPATDNEANQISFAQPVPSVSGLTRIQVVQSGRVLTEIVRSAGSPSIILGTPQLDAAAQTLALNWAASDPDGDPLLFTTQYTHDNGATWETLQVNDPALGMALSTKLLPGGNQCLLRVIATDGLNTAIAASQLFVVPRHTPVVSYTGVRAGQRVPFGFNVVVRFYGYDAEDGRLAHTSWAISGLESRDGIGDTFNLQHLPPGAYTLSFNATDRDANVGSASLGIQILPVAVPDGAVPALDGLNNDPGYDAAPPLRLIRDAADPDVRLMHADGNLYVCVSGLNVSDFIAIPASVQILFDPNLSGGSAHQIGDLGFIVDELGVVTQLQGTGSGMATAGSPASGVSAELVRTENTWNVELRIPEALLGGWNHSVGMMIWFQRYFWLSPPGVSIPAPPLFWPFGNPNEPATWAEIRLGPLPAPANRPPVAIATAPAVVSGNESQIVGLDGTGSHDPDLQPITYSWVQIEGPSVSLSDPSAAKPTFTTPIVSGATTFRFQLVVQDGQASSQPSVARLTIIPLVSQIVDTPIVKVSADGSVTASLKWPGQPGDRVVIQASTDLVHWQNLSSNSVGFLQSILNADAEARIFPYRFYRAALRPVTNQIAAGTALQFDGANDIVEVGANPALNVYPLTITAWINISQTSPDYFGVVNKYVGGSGNGYSLHVQNGRLYAWYFNGAGAFVYSGDPGFGGTFVADGQWHHVALTVDATGGRVYVDGVESSALPWTGAAGATTTSSPLSFGNYPGQASFPGQLDEITLWRRALNESELRIFLHKSLAGSESGLAGYWRFDEGVETMAADSSGFSQHGMLRNGPVWVPSTAPIWQPVE